MGFGLGEPEPYFSTRNTQKFRSSSGGDCKTGMPRWQKAFTTVKCCEIVGHARELLGGNGILLENHVDRFVADAEAI